jgi:peptidoglycan/LPS O-acetylase OafA/YrhL
MTNFAVTHSKRNHTLDIIRGVAVLLILTHHIVLPEHLRVSNFSDKLVSYFIKVLVLPTRGGWMAVDLFFVLSGFLVSGLLFNEYKKSDTIDIKRFLIRRSFKIYPPFIVFIGVTFLAELVLRKYTPIADNPAKQYLTDLFFLHNYFGGRWGQTWSLDVEEFFYVTVPFFIYFLIKKERLNLKCLIGSYIFLLFFGILMRYVAIVQYPKYDLAKQYFQTHYRLDGIFMGLLLSYVYNFRPQKLDFIINKRFILAPLAILLLSVQFILLRETNLWESVVMLALNPMAFAVLLVLALHYSKAESATLAFLGRQSYAIYLWHVVFVSYMGQYFITEGSRSIHSFSDTVFGVSFKAVFLLYVVSYLGLSIAAGTFFTWLIEVPVLKLRDRLYPSKTNLIIKEEGVMPLVN